MTAAAEKVILAKIRRGENVTTADHVPTIDSHNELNAFEDGLRMNGRLSDEIQVAIKRRRNQLEAMPPASHR